MIKSRWCYSLLGALTAWLFHLHRSSAFTIPAVLALERSRRIQRGTRPPGHVRPCHPRRTPVSLDFVPSTTRKAPYLMIRGGNTSPVRFSTLGGRFIEALSKVGTLLTAAILRLDPVQRMMFALIFLLGFLVGRIVPFWRPYRDILEVPRKYFGPTAPALRGRAVAVSDGDTLRFYHTPACWQRPPAKLKASEISIPIRLCTIDTPETPKFGKPGQPFGKEAKEALKQWLGNSAISVRLLQTDQYGRAVGQVFTGWGPFRRYADEYMLQQGLAEVYLGGGAVYGPKGLEAYLELQQQAQSKRLGIWSQPRRESAADYKRRTK